MNHGEEYAPILSGPLVETDRPARPVMHVPRVKVEPPDVDDGLPF